MSLERIIGQESAKKILKGFIKREQFNRTFLFYGPKGTGKFTTAIAFAQGINCHLVSNEQPCYTCKTCISISNLKHPDIFCVGNDTNPTIKLEESMNIHDFSSIFPYDGKYRIVIINNAHNLTTEAANNLLKLLEDLPVYLTVILISSQSQLLLPTILSRAIKIQFFLISRDQIENYLLNNFKITEGRAHLIAGLSQGNLKKAIENVDGNVLINERKTLIRYLLSVKESLLLEAMNNIRATNKEESIDTQIKLEFLSVIFRDVLMYKCGYDYLVINIDLENELKSLSTMINYGKVLECLSYILKSIKLLNNYNVNQVLFWDKITIKMRDIINA